MLHTKPVDAPAELDALKRRYLQQATAPLDGMWLTGFVPLAAHYGFYAGDELAGYCCVNGDGFLLQFFLEPRHRQRSASLFASIVRGLDATVGAVAGAFVSTAEPAYLVLCLDHLPSMAVHTLMYQLDEACPDALAGHGEPVLPLEPMRRDHLDEAVTFAMATLGAPEGWLTGYYTGLIGRGELFGLRTGGRLIAIGESRGYTKLQTGHADLGVVVAPTERGRGVATQILKDLVVMNARRGLISICSTERGNIAAQKAIGRAGFFPRHRILQFHTGPDSPTDAADQPTPRTNRRRGARRSPHDR